MPSLRALADPDRLRDVYHRHAAGFDAHRHKILIERAWLDRALDLAPPGAVLDLGCGAVDPMGLHLARSGRPYVGLDFAPAMLDLARQRLAEASFIEADMRSLQLERRFALIVGWDSFFHLTPEDQRELLPRLVDHLDPGGVLLLTCGPEAGEVTGVVEGEPVYHASLALDEYTRRLAEHGAEVVDFVPEDPDCDFHSVLLARRLAGAG